MRYLLLALLVFVPALAHGATIQMSIATRVVVEPSGLRVEIDLHNHGDETARDVVPSVEFQGRVVTGAALAALEPAHPQTVAIDVPYAGPAQPRGRWPVLVRMRYVDSAGGRAFDAIHADVARFDDVPDSPLRLDVPDVRLGADAVVRIRVDRADVGERVRLAFATPAGVVVTPRVIDHDPGLPSVLSLTLSNAGATPTSRLPLVTIAEYDTPDGHQAVVVVSMIDVGPSASRTRVMVIASIIALALIGGWVAATKARPRR